MHPVSRSACFTSCRSHEDDACSIPGPRRQIENGPGPQSACWEKRALVLQGAPDLYESVQILKGLFRVAIALLELGLCRRAALEQF